MLYVCRAYQVHRNMKLSKAEEQVMQYLWKLNKAFMKDLLAEFPAPKPATTTVATLLKRMKNKGYVDYEQVGKAREYFATVKKTDYFTTHINGLIKNFFNDSSSQFASFFTSETDLSVSELEDLKRIIDQQIKKNKK